MITKFVTATHKVGVPFLAVMFATETSFRIVNSHNSHRFYKRVTRKSWSMLILQCRQTISFAPHALRSWVMCSNTEAALAAHGRVFHSVVSLAVTSPAAAEDAAADDYGSSFEACRPQESDMYDTW
ncbi:hypothetical protein E4U17_000768 [Claviceps sp. LM77 group G4]|nr:hypothetical protein E4U17_000768 [Claviceps sp. LM77 group G4]KAG6084570.1 hypothetical protein E4U16_001467 [Claviceps sp. LM84 group G4]